MSADSALTPTLPVAAPSPPSLALPLSRCVGCAGFPAAGLVLDLMKLLPQKVLQGVRPKLFTAPTQHQATAPQSGDASRSFLAEELHVTCSRSRSPGGGWERSTGPWPRSGTLSCSCCAFHPRWALPGSQAPPRRPPPSPPPSQFQIRSKATVDGGPGGSGTWLPDGQDQGQGGLWGPGEAAKLWARPDWHLPCSACASHKPSGPSLSLLHPL